MPANKIAKGERNLVIEKVPRTAFYRSYGSRALGRIYVVLLPFLQRVQYSTIRKMAERVGFEPGLSNGINKLEGVNGTSNL